jgi:sulfite reductase (NADPH) hemoprotein beta-component
VVYSVQPNLINSGPFSPTLNHLYSTKTPNSLRGQITEVHISRDENTYKQVVPLRFNADPFLTPLSKLRLGKSVSITTTSDSLLLAIPHLYSLSSYPIVIHVVLSNGPSADFSTITALRQTGFVILQSTSLQEVQDLALISHSLALASGKGVIHFTEASQMDLPIPHENAKLIGSLLEFKKTNEASNGPISNSLYRRDLEDEADSASPSEILSNKVEASTNNGTLSNGNSHRPANDTNGHQTNGNGDAASVSSSMSDVNDETASKDSAQPIHVLANTLFRRFQELTNREYHPFDYVGAADAHSALVLFGSGAHDFKSALAEARTSDAYHGFGLIIIRLYRPWLPLEFWSAVPNSVRKIAVVEQLRHRPTKWGPVFMDVLTASRSGAPNQVSVISYQLGQLDYGSAPAALTHIATNLESENPQQNLSIGNKFVLQSHVKLEQPQLENAYVKMLQQLFGDKLNVLNATEVTSSPLSSEISSAPEFLLGSYLGRLERRKRLVSEISGMARSGELGKTDVNSLLSQWLNNSASSTSPDEELVTSILGQLQSQNSPIAQKLLSDPWLLRGEVPWIIGSEAWAFDLGSSGIHHVLASGKNVNMLIIDSKRPSREQTFEDRKKDIGLYAMNFGNAYVASVAVYSSYTQVLHAMVEAQQFNGPSIVLAYLPYTSELDSPIQLLQDTKAAVDSGYWPLYRWTPASASGDEPVFQLDSERVKKELKAFIDRENHLTHIVKGNVEISPAVSHSHGSELKQLRKVKAKQAMERLVDGLSGPPVTILFASDGGNAENVSKRLGRRAKARGLKPKVLAMDDFPIEDLPNEKNVIFVTSTAGQGEFPQNGRETWDALKNSTDLDLAQISFTVFALGDSHYWPRKEDKLYYNKPGKDLDARLEILGAQRLIEIGLGDDQDPDGYETGYNQWEPELWKALGADEVDADFEEPKPLTNEDIKIASNFLRGTIAEGLADTSTGAIAESDAQLTKFHGTYMQDDRDLREERKSQGLEPAYSFMVRVRMSAGVCQPEQWIAMDEISDKWGNETFKLVIYFAYLD